MTAPGRRWFRFSLRTLFVVVTVVALVSRAVPMLVDKYQDWAHPFVMRECFMQTTIIIKEPEIAPATEGEVPLPQASDDADRLD